MTKSELSPKLLALLRRVDTPTVCNAIEVAQGKRGFNAFTKSNMLCSAPETPAMVGFARTAKISARNPSPDSPKQVRERRMEYFRAMAAGPRPAVAVVEDIDFPACVGAWWGEVHSTVHHGLGLSGAMTNGLMRDLGDLQPGFPLIAGAIGPSHAFVHVREIGGSVNIFDMTVQQGDLIHADRHGGLVIPRQILTELATAIKTLQHSEQLILGPASQPDFDITKLETAWAAFEKART